MAVADACASAKGGRLFSIVNLRGRNMPARNRGIMKIFSLTLLICGTAASALSCDLCAVYSANQAHGERGEGFFAGFAEQFTHFGTLQLDGTEVSNTADQRLDSSITQLFAG